MAGPELEDPGEIGADDGGENDAEEFGLDEPEEPESEPEPDQVGEVDLGVGGDGIIDGFDGVEEDEPDEQPSGETESGETGGGREGAPDIEDAIEEGLAELSVVGLRGRQRNVMRSEMQAVASKFKLGYFGREVGEKYLSRDLDDIPPEYGLAAALAAFAAVTIYKRPDGQQKVEEAVAKIRNQFGGEEGVTNASEPAQEPAEPTEAAQPSEPAEPEPDNE